MLVSVYTGCPFGGTRNVYPTSCQAESRHRFANILFWNSGFESLGFRFRGWVSGVPGKRAEVAGSWNGVPEALKPLNA